MEELFLRAVLAGQELDVVDEEDVDGAVLVSELAHLRGLDGGDDLVHEVLRGQVDDAFFGKARPHVVADGVHQMGLAQPHAAVQEERVVALAGSVRHGLGGGMGKA